MRHSKAIAATFIAFAAGAAITAVAQPRYDYGAGRRIPIDSALIETVRIESQMNSWTLRKLCIDGQAYWLGLNETSPSSFAPSYKEGKPERCNSR